MLCSNINSYNNKYSTPWYRLWMAAVNSEIGSLALSTYFYPLCYSLVLYVKLSGNVNSLLSSLFQSIWYPEGIDTFFWISKLNKYIFKIVGKKIEFFSLLKILFLFSA